MSIKSQGSIAESESDNAYGFLIERTAKLIKQHFQQQLKSANAEITVDQWVVLYELYQENGLSQYEIASRTFKHAPTITRILDNLCKQDFLIRKMDVDDRRRFNVQLTDKGRAKVIDLLPTVKAFRKQGWNGLTDEEFKSLKSILNSISQNLL